MCSHQVSNCFVHDCSNVRYKFLRVNYQNFGVLDLDVCVNGLLYPRGLSQSLRCLRLFSVSRSGGGRGGGEGPAWSSPCWQRGIYYILYRTSNWSVRGSKLINQGGHSLQSRRNRGGRRETRRDREAAQIKTKHRPIGRARLSEEPTVEQLGYQRKVSLIYTSPPADVTARVPENTFHTSSKIAAAQSPSSEQISRAIH